MVLKATTAYFKVLPRHFTWSQWHKPRCTSVRIAVTGAGTPEQQPTALQPHQPFRLTEKGSREKKNWRRPQTVPGNTADRRLLKSHGTWRRLNAVNLGHIFIVRLANGDELQKLRHDTDIAPDFYRGVPGLSTRRE
jgi:hypothetical protein